MSRSNVFVLCLPLTTFSCVAFAQDAQSKISSEPIQQVQVTGPGAAQLRRDDALGRIVVGRDDLQRFGDTTLSGVLKRQPGLSIANNEIRMRGLGAGYTQILVNGEPVSANFAIDSLSPDLIERIEIQRSAQADTSAQAVAGSINIVLKKISAATRHTLKLGAERLPATISPSASLQWSARNGMATYGLTTTLSENRRREHPTIDTYFTDGDAVAVRRFNESNDNRTRKLALAPRIDLKLDKGGTIGWQTLFDLTRQDLRGRQLETTFQGSPTASPDSDWRALFDSWLVKSDLSWSQPFDTSRLTLKAGFEASGRDGDYIFHGIDSAGIRWLNRAVDSGAYEKRTITSGKYVKPLDSGHNLAFGWDAAMTKRSESRHQQDTGPDARPFYTLHQDYDATVERLALYAQDEWTIDERLQAYLGLRWEGLDTRTSGRDFDGASTASQVLSPIVQIMWKLPHSKRDQLRISLARTYKAPKPVDMVPRRYTVNNDNGPARPDYQGNPLLRPELAWGLDVALESYFERNAMTSISVYTRRIRDVMLLQLWRENGTWVSTPANNGGASVHGIELEARLPIALPALGGTTFELRTNVARNWSRVDGVPAPDNRLGSQAPLTANLGFDAAVSGGVNVGANMHFVKGWRARTSPGLTDISGVVRELEAYTAWQAAGGKWRLTLSDLLRPTQHDSRVYDSGGIYTSRVFSKSRHLLLRLQYEMPI